MVTRPGATPVITPVEAPAVAMEVLVLPHTPPVVASVKVIVDPTHVEVGPAIDPIAGVVLMVSSLTTKEVPQLFTTS